MRASSVLSVGFGNDDRSRFDNVFRDRPARVAASSMDHP